MNCNTERALFTEIERRLQKGAPVRLAIEGNAAAGKSTFALRLKERFGAYNVNVLHMDDFFLPPALRTPSRLQEPGGNVHYERFAREVLPGLMSNAPFTYGVFDCSVMEITHTVTVGPGRLTIVEGAYSLHPRFGTPYDLCAFISAAPETQRRRILARNGPEQLKRFESIWIPMENAYFEAFGIREKCDFVLRAEEIKTDKERKP